jgi:hypothetical protein
MVRPHQLLWRRVLGLSVLALACLLSRAISAQSVSLYSEARHFSVRVIGLREPEQVNRMHGFGLFLTTADGTPAAGAAVRLTGHRLHAPNSLPTAPRVSPGPEAGAYLVEGLRFHMAGEWRLIFEIESGKIRDSAMLDIVVK